MGVEMMASTNDPKCITSLNYVLDAFRTERAYQLRRWGCRQPDGTMVEAPHSVADFVLYMQDYYAEARHRASREAGIASSAEALRKVVCLGFASIEQHDQQDEGGPYTFDDIAARIRMSGRIVPLTLLPDYSNYLLKIARTLEDATIKAECFNNECALICIHELVQIGVECFMQYGIEPRDLTQPIINGRDGQPA
jgi:hypothetical protein